MEEIDKILAEAFANLVEVLTDEFTVVIEEIGAFPQMPNSDIIDTGRLRDSIIIDTDNYKTKWEWGPRNPDNGYPYAPAVYSGFLAYGKKPIPGRHWPEKAMKRVDPVSAFSAELELMGIKVSIVENNANLLVD